MTVYRRARFFFNREKWSLLASAWKSRDKYTSRRQTRENNRICSSRVIGLFAWENYGVAESRSLEGAIYIFRPAISENRSWRINIRVFFLNRNILYIPQLRYARVVLFVFYIFILLRSRFQFRLAPLFLPPTFHPRNFQFNIYFEMHLKRSHNILFETI